MSFRRVSLSDDLPAPDWQRRRNLEVRGEPQPVGRLALSDQPPAPEWFGVRDAQVRGFDLAAQAVPMRAVAVKSPSVNGVAGGAVNPPSGPLKGRPGVAAIVAGALNTVAAGPNTSARIDGLELPVVGTVSRGPGRDIRAGGKIKGVPLSMSATGTLDPPTGRAEISASGVKGRGGIGLPSRIRIYTTPTGELQFELPGPITLGGAPLVSKGTYVIK